MRILLTCFLLTLILASVFTALRWGRASHRHAIPAYVLPDAPLDPDHCPTGQACGSSSAYCKHYAPPSTKGAKAINSLPYRIDSPGKYSLATDLTSPGIGIYITYTGGSAIDINLNGHSLTYGTKANGSEAAAIGEYGILACNTGNLNSESLDSSYGTSGYCASAGVSAKNVTIENGTIIQSPNASQFYDPQNCPGSGVGSGSGGPCGSHHEKAASDAIDMQYASGITIRHLTLVWQNVDSNGINLQWHASGAGDDVECNTFHDKVTQINNRAYPMGMDVIAGGSAGGTNPDAIQYNTMIGSPQMAIADNEPGSLIQYNDIDQGFYQAPPYTPFLHAYSNDYAIGSYACPAGGKIAYNYIHSVSGRGIGCIYQRDENGLSILGNYVSNQEMNTNAEYGPNGQTNGADWPNPSGCEIDGGRGFEAKGSTGLNLYNNTFIVHVGQCGGGGIVFTEYPCTSIKCPNTASAPFDVHDNKMEIVNDGGGDRLFTPQDAACYIFDSVEGNFSNYFGPFLRDNCTSDGDYVASDPYSGGDYLSFISPTYARGSHPLASGCGNVAKRTCGHMMHWMNQGGSAPPDELGYVFQDVTTSNGALINFSGEPPDGRVTLTPRGATVEWTYTPTVKNGAGAPVAGATIAAAEADGHQSKCQTNASGQCTVVLKEATVTSPAGSSHLTTTKMVPPAVVVRAPGCADLSYSVEITSVTSDSRTLSCQ